ncbi:MAG: type II secretion system protein [Patescibacteria group bacterium]
MKQGFTLIELLVVIAIIGILSLGIFTQLESARTQARAARAVQMFQQIEKAIQVEYASVARYPRENEMPGDDINTIINNGYLSGLSPNVDYKIDGKDVRYDNDGDSREECSGVTTAGASLYVEMSDELKTAIENLVDGGDGENCGKIRSFNSILLYRLQNDPSKFP